MDPSCALILVVLVTLLPSISSREYGVSYNKQSITLILPESTEKPWPLKWFPRNPEAVIQPSPAVDVSSLSEGGMAASPKRMMGQVNSLCDDAKTNLTLDDDGKSHLCLNGAVVPVDPTLEPKFDSYDIPERYVAIHRCMNERIEYDYRIPTL